jgi:hypothetical protein
MSLTALCLLGACASGPSSPGFDPPRLITCQDIDLLNGTRRVDRSHVGLPAEGSRYRLADFTVLAPSGSGWCLSQRRGSQSTRITFVKNNYLNEALSSPPDDRRRWHTFLVYGVQMTRPIPWDLASLQDAEQNSVESPSLILLSAQVTPLHKFGMECVWSERVFRYPWQVNLIMRERGYSCIHPRNRNDIVSLTASERHIEGAPYYSPPLLETLRPEYQPYLDSLQMVSAAMHSRE